MRQSIYFQNVLKYTEKINFIKDWKKDKREAFKSEGSPSVGLVAVTVIHIFVYSRTFQNTPEQVIPW